MIYVPDFDDRKLKKLPIKGRIGGPFMWLYTQTW